MNDPPSHPGGGKKERYFIKVVIFTNKEVESDIEKVITRIENEIKSRIQSPPWGI
jgi:hypothetical protein